MDAFDVSRRPPARLAVLAARRHERWFGRLVVVVALASPALIFLVRWFEPTESAFYPRCALYLLTGLHCPFCGGTRCAHALLNGDVLQALAWNPIAVVVLPAAVIWLYWAAWRILRQRPVPAVNPPAWVIWSITAFIAAFFVLRNLPVAPFDLLAPHRVQ